MKILGYILIAFLTISFLGFICIATPVVFPCVAYPNAYFKTRAFGDKVEAFRIKHGHLPGTDDTSYPVVVEFDPGDRFGYLPDASKYMLLTYAKYDPADKKLKPHGFGAAFDGPWVIYDASAKSVSCGHR